MFVIVVVSRGLVLPGLLLGVSCEFGCFSVLFLLLFGRVLDLLICRFGLCLCGFGNLEFLGGCWCLGWRDRILREIVSLG